MRRDRRCSARAMSSPLDGSGATRSADLSYVALHYLCLTRLMHEKPSEAWRIVGDAWGLGKHAVRWVIADNQARALAMLESYPGDPATLLLLCEQRARGGPPDFDDPSV